MLLWPTQLAARIDEHTVTGEVLRDDPPGEPHERPVWPHLNRLPPCDGAHLTFTGSRASTRCDE